MLKLNPSAKAPILCLVGPPGVGKTSLGQSVARSLGRVFERISLGGLHDEAELRGHRRTYVGAMPGRIIQALRRAAAKNPVVMLDEVDKVGRDFRGDPASALLEILDPAQNHTFRDNYLDLPFDLSKVMFITTANTLDTVSRPLLDRMEVIRLPGYSQQEKQEIARRYLWPRRLEEAGLTSEQVNLEDESLAHIIQRYTREAGVRQLEQMLGRLTRKVALHLAEHTLEPPAEAIKIQREGLGDWLGVERFMPEEARKELPIGVATGLAWTEAGGDVLYVESSLLPGGSDLTITGHIGEVMQGIRPSCPKLLMVSRRIHGARYFTVQAKWGPYPRPGRSHSQRRPVSRRDHGHSARLGVFAHACTKGHRHDGRNQFERFGITRGGYQRKSACRSSLRYPTNSSSKGK